MIRVVKQLKIAWLCFLRSNRPTDFPIQLYPQKMSGCKCVDCKCDPCNCGKAGSCCSESKAAPACTCTDCKCDPCNCGKVAAKACTCVDCKCDPCNCGKADASCCAKKDACCDKKAACEYKCCGICWNQPLVLVAAAAVVLGLAWGIVRPVCCIALFMPFSCRVAHPQKKMTK